MTSPSWMVSDGRSELYEKETCSALGMGMDWMTFQSPFQLARFSQKDAETK